MKIKPEHFQIILSAMQVTSNKNPGILERARYEGHTLSRFGHFILYASQVNGEDMSKWICDNIYPYADDTHLKTVVLRIARDIQENHAYLN